MTTSATAFDVGGEVTVDTGTSSTQTGNGYYGTHTNGAWVQHIRVGKVGDTVYTTPTMSGITSSPNFKISSSLSEANGLAFKYGGHQ